MFLQRAAITLTLGPIALWLINKGGLLYFIPVTAVLILATVEYHNLTQLMGWNTSLKILLPVNFTLWAAGQWPDVKLLNLALIVGLFLAMLYGLYQYEYNFPHANNKDETSNKTGHSATGDWIATIGGIILIGWIGSHFFLVRSLGADIWQWAFLSMLATWISDSAAYLVGKFMAGNFLLGRHQLSPRLSPNKTIEGYSAGILFSTIVTVTVAYFIDFPVTIALILALLVSTISPLGDLAMSLLKREANVKDSGTMFAGHGGALDRIDSLVWSVTMGYYLAIFVG